MKKILSCLSIALIIPAMSWSQDIISGQVLSGVAGTTGYAPVVGAQVTLISGEGSQASVVDAAVTDANGNYSFNFSALGFMQVAVSATGYTPNPNVAVVAVNSDTINDTVNFTYTTPGGANAPGSSDIGGKVTSGGNSVSAAQVILRRRATATSAWVPVDTTMSDSNGVYNFSNILAAGTGTSANAYSLVVSATGYATYTSGSLTVANDQTTLSNPTLTAAALYSAAPDKPQSIRFSTVGDRLALDLGVSNIARTVSIYNLSGALQQRVAVTAGESQVTVPATYAKGFLFQVR